MRIVFMGSPALAAAALAALSEAGHDIACVFTREAKPAFRGKILTQTAVAAKAEELNLLTYTPKSLKDEETAILIASLKPQMIVVVAYGCILPLKIINIPKFGAINLHVSLLPKYRGSAPIQRAIMAGEMVTGVTIMRIDEGLDTGDIISRVPIILDGNDTAGDVFKKVEVQGIPLLIDTINNIEKGKVEYTSQNNSDASYASPIKKDELKITINRPAIAVHNLARGVYPFLHGSVTLCDTVCKLCKTEVLWQSASVGEIINLKPLTIACSEGSIIIHELLPEGKKIMSGTAFAVGRRLKVGDKIR